MGKIVLIQPIANQWSTQLDLIYRRNSDASYVSHGSDNMFHNSFQYVYRPWIHFHPNKTWRFSLSPLGMWQSYSNASETKGTIFVQPELRICPQIIYTSKIQKLSIDHRARYEYRLLGIKTLFPNENDLDYSFGFDPATFRQRMRYMTRILIPLGHHQKIESNTSYLTISNEVFFNIGSNIPILSSFDQDRLFALIGYKFYSSIPLRVEMGIGTQWIHRTNIAIAGITIPNITELNHVIQIGVIVENCSKIFSKKDE